jgi:acetyltransferase-like isoleucine patch superfamily enzyme
MKRAILRGLSHVKSVFIRLALTAKSVNFDSPPVFSGKWPKINNRGHIYLAKNCSFRSYRTRPFIWVSEGATLEIGKNTFFNDGANLCATVSVKIGSNCKIGDMTFIFDTDYHQVTPENPIKQAPVTIGDNVWIGARSTILAGAKIGSHCVIAAGSTVVGEIPAKSLAGGSPARVIRKLNVPDDWVRA